MNVKNEVAMVTGASSGIGAAVAVELALLARRREKLDYLVDQIQANGGRAYAYPIDLRDADALEETLARVHRELGPTRRLNLRCAHYHRSEEKARTIYNQYHVLSPEDVARHVTFVLTQPPHVQIHDLLLRPTEQLS